MAWRLSDRSVALQIKRYRGVGPIEAATTTNEKPRRTAWAAREFPTGDEGAILGTRTSTSAKIVLDSQRKMSSGDQSDPQRRRRHQAKSHGPPDISSTTPTTIAAILATDS
jgi:hypothetical protein